MMLLAHVWQRMCPLPLDGGLKEAPVISSPALTGRCRVFQPAAVQPPHQTEMQLKKIKREAQVFLDTYLFVEDNGAILHPFPSPQVEKACEPLHSPPWPI